MLILLETFELKQTIDNAFRSEDSIYNVSCIRPFSKGFFIASDNGYIAMWVKSEENNSSSTNNLYDFIRKWQSPSTRGIKIMGLSVSPGEELLAVACKNNNIGLV